MIKLAPLGPLVLLAACGQPAPRSPAAPATPAGHGGYIARVQALTPGQRASMLFGAVQKSGGSTCQGVTAVKSMPASATGQPTWRVTCSEGSEWVVALSDDGTALVTGAHDAGRVSR